MDVVPLTLRCADAKLVGLLHRPEAHKRRRLGVVIVAGAPQYRVGSHRQFLLLARDLAAAGYPVLRFDYRGIGDSDGTFEGFEAVDADLRSAIDGLTAAAPGLEGIVLWGLCDGASAAAFYAAGDERVSGLVLVNPWVRSEVTVAQARVRSYYRARILSSAFWCKLLSGRLDLRRSIASFAGTVSAAFARPSDGAAAEDGGSGADLAARVSAGLKKFQGHVLLILSGADLTAQEFDQAVLGAGTMNGWTRRPSVTVQRLAHANHTYSTQDWRARVHAWTVAWLNELGGAAHTDTRQRGN